MFCSLKSHHSQCDRVEKMNRIPSGSVRASRIGCSFRRGAFYSRCNPYRRMPIRSNISMCLFAFRNSWDLCHLLVHLLLFLGAVAKRYKTSKAHSDEGKPSKGDVLAVDGRRCCLFHLMGSSPTSVSRISDPIHGE